MLDEEQTSSFFEVISLKYVWRNLKQNLANFLELQSISILAILSQKKLSE